MSTLATIAELLKMPLEDLIREIQEQRTLVARLRLEVKMGKQKDIAKYQREKKQLARMLTVMVQKQEKELQNTNSDTTLSAPSADASKKATAASSSV